MASSSYSTPPCAACKLLRRKCTPDCIYAPYFPPEETQKFANVHKIFGASNVSKLLNEIPPHQREDAVNSLAYEAEARMKDPVYGCVGAISILQRQVMRLQRELDATNADLIRFARYEMPAATAAISQYGRRTAAGHGGSNGENKFFNQNSGFYYPSQWNNNDSGGDNEGSGSGSM